MLAAFEHAGVEQAIDIAWLHRPIADVPLWPLDLDGWLEPIHAARAGTDDGDIKPARLCGLEQGARNFVGADAKRARIPRDEDARAHACASLSSASSFTSSSMPYTRSWSSSAAGELWQSPRQYTASSVTRASARGFAKLHAELLLGARRERIAARGLAGFGATELEHTAPRRLVAEVVVEGHRPVDLGAGKVQCLGDHGDRCFRNAAKGVLKCMQNGQGGAILVLMRRDNRRSRAQRPITHI